ncbi:hypothetical protein FCM35_KLT09395 [Carex littledalei]|uniref:Uncharacterized protein n=1 Tax=Carex littledalei TaxID=544730 RepID=A0A833RRF0_9POAL|nr:hypothetical protein FCM35_KLT09395 [Carex littledalei]
MHGETPFTSAPSSPGRSIAPSTTTNHTAYFFSAPASPTHFLLSSCPSISTYTSPGPAVDLEQPDFEFGLASRLMSTAEELFFNGQIRPGFVSADPACIHRRTRSVSPTRTPRMIWREKRKESASLKAKLESKAESNSNTVPEIAKSDKLLELGSASTSRSSSSNSSSCNSSNTNSRRWGFIKDLLLQRSKSEGRMPVTAGARARPVQRQRNTTTNNYNNCVNGCNVSENGRGRLTYSSSFSLGLCKERHDKAETTVRLVKDARRRTTFLPYKQQGFLFGCLGFSSRGFVRNVGIPTVSPRHPHRHR